MAMLYRHVSAAIKSPFISRIKFQGIFTQKYSNDVTKRLENGESCITLTDDGSMVVCWHPEKKFPYEHSKPIPIFASEFNESDSVLKVQHRLLHKYRFRPSGPEMAELQKLTFTTKHQWYQNNRWKKEKLIPPPDRESL
uniref:Large ribosomal subunit protein mL42 n=1 Tax=Strigamia maritima TaxID=126957 RepID=T1JK08_STRMM